MSDDKKPIAGGIKFDTGKPRVSLLSSKFLLGMGQVMEFGQRKYAQNNWRNGIAVSRLLDAASRHLLKWTEGDDTDEESGQDHLFHAAIDLMMAWETARTRPSFDDRFILELAKPEQLLPLPLQSEPHPEQARSLPRIEGARTIWEELLELRKELLEQFSQESDSAQSQSVTARPKS